MMALTNLTKGKTLRSHCVTRWSSLYLMINRVLELQDQVTAVCIKNKKDGLLPSQWNNLSQIRQLLEPFADHTTALEANNTTSISLVIPAICDLEKHLQKMISEGICKKGAQLLLTNLKNRFYRYMDASALQFDPVFILATALDPRYKWILTDEQKNVAKDCLVNELKDSTENESTTLNMNVIQSANGPTSSKRFKNLLIDYTVSDESGKAIEEEVSSYLESNTICIEEEWMLDYWKSCNVYPNLADFAVDLLVIPCSSSASETLFSHAGFLSSGMKSRINSDNLENQLLIKTNHKLLL